MVIEKVKVVRVSPNMRGLKVLIVGCWLSAVGLLVNPHPSTSGNADIAENLLIAGSPQLRHFHRLPLSNTRRPTIATSRCRSSRLKHTVEGDAGSTSLCMNRNTSYDWQGPR